VTFAWSASGKPDYQTLISERDFRLRIRVRDFTETVALIDEMNAPDEAK
jgi:hypothetical protein